MSHAQIRELAIRAVRDGDHNAASQLSNACSQLGFNHAQTFQFVQEWTNVDPVRWEALLGEEGE